MKILCFFKLHKWNNYKLNFRHCVRCGDVQKLDKTGKWINTDISLTRERDVTDIIKHFDCKGLIKLAREL